jgi:hypothetical protein
VPYNPPRVVAFAASTEVVPVVFRPAIPVSAPPPTLVVTPPYVISIGNVYPKGLLTLLPSVTAPNPANSVDVGEPELPTPDKSVALTDPVYVLAVLVPVPPTSLTPAGVPPIKRFGLYVDCPKSVLPSD